MRGEAVVITKNGPPGARLTAAGPSRKESRRPGSARGQTVISDDLDDPLPDEIQKFFEGRSLDINRTPAPLDTSVSLGHYIDNGYIERRRYGREEAGCRRREDRGTCFR